MLCARQIYGLLIMVLSASMLCGAERLAGARVLPPVIASDVIAVVRAENSMWLFDQIDQLGGEAALPVRLAAAEAIFNARSDNGVDVSRPALLAWRSGPSPMVAMIPVADRQQLVEEFGSLRIMDRLLIRTGERDGTIIYQQVVAGERWEYRLLFRDDYAYFARTKEECEALAAHPLRLDPERPAISAEWSGAFLAQELKVDRDALALTEGAGLFAGQAMTAVFDQWEQLVSQVAVAHVELGPGADGALAVGLSLHAQNGTALATWMARQTNAASRLLSLVGTEESMVTMHGAMRWDGEIEQFGRMLAAFVSETAAALDQPVEEQLVTDLQEFFALSDRMGPFAVSAGPADPDNILSGGSVVRTVVTQPRAADVVTLQRSLDAYDQAAGVEKEVGEFEAIAGLLGYRMIENTDKRQACVLTVAARDYVLRVTAPDEQRALVELRTLIDGLNEQRAPTGGSGALAIRMKLDRVFEMIATTMGEQALVLEPMTVDIAARVQTDGSVAMSFELPIDRIQEAVSRLGFDNQ